MIRWLFAVAATGCLLVACTPSSANALSSGATSSPRPPGLSASASASPEPPGVFTLSAIRARQVSTVVRIIDAYNAGRLDDVMPLLDDGITWTDCDYKAVALVALVGKTQVVDYVRRRFANHDQFTIANVWNQNPGPDGADTVGVDFSRRMSDTIRALGFPTGIRPALAAKVIFDSTGGRITRFANGPGGGSTDVYRPTT
jgi:hypothetical protein